MKTKVLAGGLVCLASLSGCASHNVISREVETAPGVNVVSTDNGVFIGSIAVRRALTSNEPGQVQSCLSSNIERSASTQSAASGPEQQAAADTNASSNSTEPLTEHVSGWTELATTDETGRTLAYRLELQTIGSSNYYYFDQLGVASSRSHNVHDYSPIGAWDSATPKAAYAALGKVTDSIQNCLSGQTNGAQPANAAASQQQPQQAAQQQPQQAAPQQAAQQQQSANTSVE